MYLSKAIIEGYKNFINKFEIEFTKGLNIIVGENATGKTGIINAIRMILKEDEYGYLPVSDRDFHTPFQESNQSANNFTINAEFGEMDSSEKIVFLPWLNKEENATLNLIVENKTNFQGKYQKVLWGGMSKASIFEQELFDFIHCIYLPPLRDAEAKLTEGKGSRLARLIKNINKAKIEDAKKTGKRLSVEEAVSKFNKTLIEDNEISKANKLIKEKLEEALGKVFGQETQIQFSNQNFNRIIENLRLLFFPMIGQTNPTFRSLEENSLGYNNIIYLATVLAELGNDGEQNNALLKILLIEEPEAHLHPQLQIQLLKYLEQIANEKNIQIIITTHSPVLASSVSIDRLIHLSTQKEKTVAIPIHKCGLKPESTNFINRWLDATKSTLLFAKGVILVEGIAEALLLPELAKQILKNEPTLPDSLEEAGVSVINMNGIYFKHFMQIFCNLEPNDTNSLSLPIRCAGITDNDPKQDKPTPDNCEESTNPAKAIVETAKQSEFSRLFFSPLKTFEYDLSFENNNLTNVAKVLKENWSTDGPIKISLEALSKKNLNASTLDNEKASDCAELLERISDSQYIGKGLFAQLLADELKEGKISLTIPNYLKQAVLWACGGHIDE